MILHFHSFFSLRYGMMSPQEIVQRCESEAISMRQKVAILLADINNVSGVSNYLRAARDCKHILPLVGCDIRNGDRHLYLLLCESQSGFAQMNAFLSEHLMGGRAFPEVAPEMLGVKVIYPLSRWRGWRSGHKETSRGYGDDVNETCLSGDAWGIGIPWVHLDRLRLWKKPLPTGRLLAIQTVTVRDEIDFETHRLLRCIDHNCLLSKLPEGATAEPWQHWLPLRQIFSNFVAAKHLITQAQAFAEGCAWSFEWTIQQN
ncbi:MAG: polymerase alpha subunit, partial [Bacteroidota bacterium]